MTQNQDETYFHDLGHEGACTAFYRGCFGNLFGGTRTPMFDGFSRVLMDLICFDGLQFRNCPVKAVSQSLCFQKRNLLTCFLI